MIKILKSRRFQFHPIAALAALISLAILITLGTWQLHRLEWKQELIAAIEARANGAPVPLSTVLERRAAGEDMRYTRVRITGRYDHDKEAHIFGSLGPKPGYYIFTPIRTTDRSEEEIIFVNRGFVPQAFKERDARSQGLINKQTQIIGLFREAERKRGLAALVAPTDQPKDNIWYIRAPQRFAPHIIGQSVKAPDWYIDSEGLELETGVANVSAAERIYPIGNVTKRDFNNRHMEYALTWYGLALTLIGVFLAYSLRR